MQAQADTPAQADYQGGSSQQAPTFGLVGPDSSCSSSCSAPGSPVARHWL